MLEWSAPVESLTPDWVDALVLPYEALVTLVEPMLGDALVARQWPRVQAILDVKPEPTSAALVNARWVEFVGGVWKMVEGYWQRQAAADCACGAVPHTVSGVTVRAHNPDTP